MHLVLRQQQAHGLTGYVLTVTGPQDKSDTAS